MRGLGRMRKILNWMYWGSEAAAALFIVCICVTVLVQVSFNIVDKIAVAAGGQAIGLVLPSYAEFTGNFLAASTFFALAGSLKNGAHIRVTLLIRHLSALPHRLTEGWCCTLGAAITVYFTYWTANLVYESWAFGDVSPGIIAVPLWIPQLPMILGLVCLVVAFVDGLVQVIRGGEPHYVQNTNRS